MTVNGKELKLVDEEFDKFENHYYEPENPPDLGGEPESPYIRNVLNDLSMQLDGKPVYSEKK